MTFGALRAAAAAFLSGRPPWANPETNASDAFAAVRFPRSEGAGGSANRTSNEDER